MTSVTKGAAQDPISILLVDDDLDALRLTGASLKAYFQDQLELFQKASAPEALQLLEAHPVEIVITDLDMVDANGFHILKSIKAKRPLTQVIIVTGHDSSNALQSACVLGTDDFFVKPVSKSELIASIHFLHARVQRWQQSIDGLPADSGLIAN